MTYFLGVDLGTSYTAAAISRDGVLELVSLGTRSLEIPSVAFLDPSGTVVVGESAERRGAGDPTRLAREFKRRLGDPAPILVAGTPFSAEALMATVLRSVVADVSRRQGEPPAHVTLTRPANWGPYKQELFSHVPVLADLGPWTAATEPEAAAVHFASTTRVGSGQAIAVYDLGGGTFDAAVLRKTEDGFATLGSPEGIEHLGGADFDDAVFEYVRRVLGPAFAQLDPTDPGVRMAAGRLRAECVLAKESLSRDTEATIPVTLPGLSTEVRLTRQDFEDLVRPALMSTVESLRRTVRSARTPVDQIAATVLAGGSSRIPLVAELITGELQLPVAVGTHPKHTVALGAALLAARDAGRPRIDEPTGRFNPGVVAPILSSGPLPTTPRSGPVPVGATWDTDQRAAAAPARPTDSDDTSATGSGLFGMPNRAGVLHETRSRPWLRRTAAIWVAAAVAAVLVATLLITRPWSGSSSAGSTGATSGDATTPPSSAQSADTAIGGAGVRCDPTTLALLGMKDVDRPVDTDTTGDTFRPAELGAGMINAAQLAVDQFNTANPECVVKLQVYDTRHTQQGTAQVMPKILADPQVVGIVGASFAGELFKAEETAEPAGLVVVSGSAKSPGFGGRHYTTFNRVIAHDQIQGQAAARYLTNTLKVTKVVLVDDGNEQFGVPVAKIARDGLGDLAVGSASLDPADPDTAGVLSTVKATAADAVYFAGSPALAGTVLTQLRQSGYQGVFLEAEAFNTARILQTASPEVAKGALLMCTCAPATINEGFTAAYRAAFKADPTTFAPETYDATQILLRGIARGERTRQQMTQFVRSYTGVGITKPIAFDQNGDVVGQPTFVYKIQADGSVVQTAFVN